MTTHNLLVNRVGHLKSYKDIISNTTPFHKTCLILEIIRGRIQFKREARTLVITLLTKLERLIGRKFEKVNELSLLGTSTIKELVKLLSMGLLARSSLLLPVDLDLQ